MAPPVNETSEIHIPGLEADEEGARIVGEELKLLATVLGALERAARSEIAGAKMEDDARLLELREEIAVAKPEDLPALFEQMHTLGALRAQRGKSVSGLVDLKSPYFGHLRLEETFATGDKKPRRRDVLVGGRSYVDAGAGIRVVDWRNAPVSRIFYRYREGDDYEEILGDRPVEGAVLARRSVAIVGGTLRRVSAPQGTFLLGKDGKWERVDPAAARLVSRAPGEKAALGVGSDGRPRKDKLLPAIAAMLDSAQYDLITKPGAGVVAIQGSAGSGKTTVGLHRVAYLVATDPGRYKPERILVVVPTEALIHYTARVLPELGVEGVPVMTFARWATRVLGDLYPKLPTRLSSETPAVVIRAKSHARMLQAIDALAAARGREIDDKLRKAMARWEKGDVAIAAWERTKGAPDQRVSELARWVSGKRDLAPVPPAAELPEVTRQAITALGGELRKISRGVLEAWDELTTSKPLLEKTFAGVKYLGPGQLSQVHAWCTEQTRIRAEGERDGETPSLDAEDVPLLLRLFQVLRGPLVDIEGMPLRTSHLFVDEVQDSSPVELRVLVDVAGKEPSITLSGDVAQRMLEDDDERGEVDWHELLRAAGVETPETGVMEPLKVSYRSTAEITGFARLVLGPYAHEAEPIANRHGPPVELFPFASPGEAVAFLADALKDLARVAPDANVAVLARFGPQADVYYDGLVKAEVMNVRRVRRQDFGWEPGVDVTDVRQTKGLEWDEVVLVDANQNSYPDSAQARHALYVGATRAAHQLWCVASDTPSAVVERAVEGAAAEGAAAEGAGEGA